MLAFTITDIKDFMNKLLLGDTFDSFSLIEASIVTFNTFTINGKLQKDFFDTDVWDDFTKSTFDYSLWRDLKSYCFSLIRGKRTPVSFKIIFRLPVRNTHKLIQNSLPDFPWETVSGLYLNLQYKNKTLLCTTGVSFSAFVSDKRPEQVWDEVIVDFLHKHNLLFEEM